jgi:AcrR family transcriptional regulator
MGVAGAVGRANLGGMSSTIPSPDDDAAIAGFWRVVAAQGWHGVTMRAVAAEAGLEPAALRRRFATPHAILLAHGQAVDAEVMAGTVEDLTSTPRDRLFDVLMRRLDALAPHREGVVRLWDDLPRTPLLGLWLAGQLPVSMAWMLEAARLSASGVKGGLRVQGLGLVWLSTLRAWAGDDGADLSATMAALDRALDQADRAARWLSLGEDEAPDAAMPPEEAGVATAGGTMADVVVAGAAMTGTMLDTIPEAAPPGPLPGDGAEDDAGLPEDWGRTPKADPSGGPAI